jgi:hypothetical protein
VAILPTFLISNLKVAPIPFIGEKSISSPKFITEGMNVSFYFGGTCPHHRWRRHGHRAAGRVAAHHAPL